ncbi:MAG TPA: deoxyribose-phosphate aldolase [Candidatus Limnocylindrales bacterium]|nr:deoxyribose-phosphate aldolase [Candidatus Limnocylindrales bacterium]
MDQQQLEKFIQAITEEILGYLSTEKCADLCGLEIDELVCPGCNQWCAEKCSKKTRKVVEAGAARISAGAEIGPIEADIARLIDHTLLKPEATRDDIRKLCLEALKFGFASVCINPWNVSQAAEILRGSEVRVCTVVGFPLGANLPQVKMFEAEESIKLGAQEIDMVINVGALRSGLNDAVEADIRGVAEASHRGGAICKVILETALLNTEEKVRGCIAAKIAGADFVKTSTGFGPGGATAEDVRLMRAVVGDEIGVKAAGGVRSLEDLQKMVEAGATRIGASASVKILEQARSTQPAEHAAAATPVPAGNY